MTKKDLSLEKVIARLDVIVRQLESGEADLEASIKLFEEGMRLTTDAQQHLQRIEERIKVLVETGPNQYEEQNP